MASRIARCLGTVPGTGPAEHASAGFFPKGVWLQVGQGPEAVTVLLEPGAALRLSAAIIDSAYIVKDRARS